MKRLLVITTLDYRGRPNNRIHHTVDSLCRKFDEVTLLCRSEPNRRGVLARATNLVPRIAPAVREGNLLIIEYNPPLNWVESHESDSGPARGRRYRRFVRKFSNLFGLSREFCFISFIALTCLLRVGGESFDVCLVESSWEGIPALLLRRLGWVKYVVFDDNDFWPGRMESGLRRRWEIFLDTICVRSSDLVITAGYMLAGLWREKTARDVVAIPNGVDLGRFQGSVKRLDRSRPSLVYVGNLSTGWMDFPVVFEALSRLVEAYDALTFHVIGDEGEGRFKELKEAAGDLGVLEKVRFHGRIPHGELPAVLSRYDIGLALNPPNPLRKYAFPLKVTEYMALGLPFLASRGDETAHIVTRYRCGLCVGLEREEIVQAIERLIEDEELYRTCSENGLKGASEFDIHALSELRYREILKGISRPAVG